MPLTKAEQHIAAEAARGWPPGYSGAFAILDGVTSMSSEELYRYLYTFPREVRGEVRC